MPIYAYKCGSCGHAKDVLQKVSDPALTVCPACGATAFSKQITAAGFQLKGSGWYATDFKGGSTTASADKGETGDKAAGQGDKAADKADKADKPAESKPADSGSAKTEVAATPSKPAATPGASS